MIAILQAPDGRLRLANLISAFEDDYDLIIFDTQGARSAMLEMVVLASDIVLSPLPPNMLAAREFNRGTIPLSSMQHLHVYSSHCLAGVFQAPLVKFLVAGTDLRHLIPLRLNAP